MNWEWINYFWVKCTFIFWIICIISSLLSPYYDYSLPRTIVWIRFPLYAAAAQVWLARDRDIRILMLTVITISLVIISFILFAEVLLEPKIRLQWPYGDVIPGSFIAKACLPVFCVLIL